ncbi:MAG: LytTR family DNA-binding domain-containing protein [Marinilabiliales bacterium]
MKAVIIDDELKAIKSIEYIVSEYCKNISIVGTAENIDEAVKVVNETNPDIVFLDIELQKGTGFDLLEKIPKRNFNVIFITAYNQYAIKAIKFSAVDYILKPIDIYEFISAVNKVVEKRNSGVNWDEKYDVLINNLNESKPTKLALPTFDGTEYINIQDIVRIEADRSYSYIFLTDKRRIVVSKSLIEFEELLADNNFFRTHKSHLVNLDHVKKHIKHDGGYAEMSDGTKVMIARRKKEEFVNAMKKFLK